MSLLKHLVAAAKGTVWLVRPAGLRRQMDYLERQVDNVYGLFDQWEGRFHELFAHFEQQAQAVLPDVVERQQQLGDKLSQLNAGFGAREARLTKWLMEIEQNGRQLMEELKKQQELIAQLQTALGIPPAPRPGQMAGIDHQSDSLEAAAKEPTEAAASR